VPEETKCPVCLTPSNRTSLNPLDTERLYDCPVCGRYRATEWAEGDINRLEESQKGLLSGCIRERTDRKQLVEISTTNLNDILSTAPATLSEKLQRFLRQLTLRTKYFGQRIVLSSKDRPLGYAANVSEFDAEIRYLIEAGYLRRESKTGMDDNIVSLTAQAITEVESIERDSAEMSNKVFVAMSFDQSLDSLYDNYIRPAILEAGYDEPVRVDREHYNDRIDDHIVVGLKQCKFTVADYTFQRNGVYYEAGYAHGQGKQVIMCCPKSEVDNLHFDTDHFKHIVYETGEELKAKLKDRILATIGPGKNYVPVP